MVSQADFQPPPPPRLQVPARPTMSTAAALTNVFVAPARTFYSFRDVTAFAPAAVRFLIAAAIIIVAVLAYNFIYLERMGSSTIAFAAMGATPLTNVTEEQKARALQVQETPTFRVIGLVMTFGRLLVMLVASMPLGGLAYWLGAMLFKDSIKFMQALLVWTYASLPPTVLWMLANTFVLFFRPPTTSLAIATGANGVIKANLGALFTVNAFPIPVHVVALSAFDLFEFYGLGLAMLGLRKLARLPWIGSFGIVISVWLFGVGLRVATAGLVGAIMR